MKRLLLGLVILLALLLGGPTFVLVAGDLELEAHWSDADRSVAGLAPNPDEHSDAIVQVYAARAYNWRGAFGVHTWIATREAGAPAFRIFEIARWRPGSSVTSHANPDRAWFGNAPQLLGELRGEDAEAAMAAVAEAAERYPALDEYRVWPGPNSNTYTAWILREVPELAVELPPTAVGKDYLLDGWLAAMPSATGYQISLGGLAGIGIARAEGIEINVLGLVIGLDPGDLALKLPGLGRVGPGAGGPAG